MALSALMLASCANEDLNGPAQDGPVVFSVQLPGEFTRAISDGSTATQLSYAVYLKGENNVLFTSENTGDPQAEAFSGLKTSLSLNLAKGKEYDIIFWADKPGNTFYDFKPAAKSVEIKYDGIVSNDEDRDAFFQKETFKVTGAETRTVILRRPFAQLNFATSDLEAANKAGLDFSKTQVTVSNVYNTLNLLTGVASNTATGDNAVTFAWNGLVNNDVVIGTTDTSKKYNWLSMNYLLTGAVPGTNIQTADSETVNCTFKVQDNNANEINSIDISNVPVQRNYRTNIYGALLTSTVDFSIEIVPGYYEEPGHNVGYVDPGKIKLDGKIFDSLGEAVSAALTENKTDVELIIGNGEYSANDFNGAANKFTTLSISGQGPATVINKTDAGNYLNGVNVVFNNLTLKSTNANYNGFQHNASETYNSCVIENKLFLYGKALFENCTFKNNGDYSVWTYGSTDATFKNCKFGDYGKSVLIYVEGPLSPVINFENCTFNGSSLNDGKAAIEVDCSFNENTRSTRNDGDIYTININNCTATGYDKGLLSGNNLWNVKKGTKFVINVNGQKVEQGLTYDGKNNYYVNTAEGLVTLSGQTNGYYKDNTLTYNRFSGQTVTLTTDIDMSGVEFTPIAAGVTSYPSISFAGTFDGANHTISNLTASDNRYDWAAAGLFGSITGKIENLTLTNVNITSTHYAGGIAGYCDNETGSLINNCKVIGGTITSVTEQKGDGWDNGDKAGGILGYGCVNADKVTNCHVEDLTIKAYRHFGSIVGFASNQANVTGNSAKNVTLLWDKTHDYKNFGIISEVPFGPVMGNFKDNNGDNTAENITLPTE